MRKIIHIDMDCFYAAVEVRERPELRGKPVAVGGTGRRGVLTTCSYEARAFGCRSAMPVFQALERCPQLILLPVRSERYRAESARIHAILRDYTDCIEPLSLDEAYLDVTGGDRYAWDIAREIRRRIREERHLTASAGVAPNKMLAKIASDWRKPDGQYAVPPDRVDRFLTPLPVRRIWGVGPKGEAFLREQNITTCGELQRVSRSRLREWFGKWGDELFDLCRGIDSRPVLPDRPRKSLSTERTFAEPLRDRERCAAALSALCEELRADITAMRPPRIVRTLFVKVKFADFRRTSRECAGREPDPTEYERLLEEALERSDQPVRLLGVGVRFISEEESDFRQLNLFESAPEDRRREAEPGG